MNFLEKNLEDIIWDNIQTNEKFINLQKRGLCPDDEYPYYKKRQLSIGNYGIADIVTLRKEFDPDLYFENKKVNNFIIIDIFELKKNIINLSALIQSIRYYKGIKRYIENKYPNLLYRINIKLIGDSFDLGDWVYLFDYLTQLRQGLSFQLDMDISIYTYKYEFDGIHFEEIRLHDYMLIEEGF